VIVMTDIPTIRAQLLGTQYRAEDIPAVDGIGIYAFYLSSPGALAGVSIEPSRLIYLGMTDSSLEVRNHFNHEHSGVLDAASHSWGVAEDLVDAASDPARQWALTIQCAELSISCCR
jgi:hypothetical protein